MRGWYERADKEKRLTKVNALFLPEIARLPGLGTLIVRDTVYPFETPRPSAFSFGASGAGDLSGPSAKVYLDEAMFRRRDPG